MKIKFGLLVLAFLSALTPVSAQRKLKKVAPGEASKNRLAEIYADSLLMCRQRIDSMKMDSGDSRYAQLFTPLTFYHGPVAHVATQASGWGEGFARNDARPYADGGISQASRPGAQY